MNLRSIDLNLLVVLDALLDEAHVSRAAARLNLSQPATSSALDRCRHLFGDPVLERGKGGMQLTPKAEALRDPLKNLLVGIAAVVDAPEEQLSEIRQTVRITTADHPGILIASQTDPWMTAEHAAQWARRWNCKYIDGGALGHINAESHLGDWVYGQAQLQTLFDLAQSDKRHRQAA